MVYSFITKKKPGIVILNDVNQNRNFKKFLDIFDHYKVKVWIAKVDRSSKKIASIKEYN